MKKTPRRQPVRSSAVPRNPSVFKQAMVLRPRSGQVGDGLGSSISQAVVPLTFGSRRLINAIANEDAYLHLSRRVVVKWHEGFEVLDVRRYRAGYIVEIMRSDGNGTAWIAALDVDYPTTRRCRVRAIGTRLMAFLHSTRVGAETTMHRYFYDRTPEDGILGPATPPLGLGTN